MDSTQHVPNGEGHGSANEIAFDPQHNTQHPLQPSSHMEAAGLQREERVQSQNANNTRKVSTRQHVRKQPSIDERRFLLAVQSGNIKATQRLIDSGFVDKNCVDPMGRTALVLAIINEDLPMVKLLMAAGVEAQDALLCAISEEFVEAVELLLDHEESVTSPGQQHSWEALPPESRTFSPDVTPLILAAHQNHFEIVRMLLDRGATLPLPHDVRCGCCECVSSRTKDTVHHSRSRINAFRALASPSLICLTAQDPILLAFQLSWELRRLSFEEYEFRNEYQELRNRCKIFATALLDHTRSSRELEVILNYDPFQPVTHGEGRMHLQRLRLAVKLHQKEFVTHPNVQQLLASIWYEGLPGFRCKNTLFQVLEIVRVIVSFPFLSLMYIIVPTSSYGQMLKKPFIKFICHSASYVTFLGILIWSSQDRGYMGVKEDNNHCTNNEPPCQGARPSIPECLIIVWLCGMIKLEVKRILGEENLKEYVKDMWKLMDLGTTCLYMIVVILRLVSCFEETVCIANGPGKKMKQSTPVMISECLLALANIFSCLRMIYIFSVSPYLGPLQVSLSRMATDMVRFFLLFVLVIFAFSCGLNQLLGPYAAIARNETATSQNRSCLNVSLPHMLRETTTYCNENETSTGESNCCLNCTRQACNVDHEIQMRFANLFEATQTLFWTVFGVIDMNQFNLCGIGNFTKFAAKTILGTYAVITIVVLLNLLIAMLNNSYQLISGKEDVEWKFARSKLWISYFDDKCTLPPPFNIFPTSKFHLRLRRLLKCRRCCRSHFISKCCSCDSTPVVTSETDDHRMELLKEQESNYKKVMHDLVRRYVTMSQQCAENRAVNEDDINEIKQDISAFRCELIDILQQSGYNVNAYCNAGLGGRKTRQRERHMMKDFDIISMRENLTGLCPGQPSHLKHVLISATAPAMTAGSKSTTSSNSSALMALKKKRKKFFSASHKSRGPSDKQIPRVGSVPSLSSSISWPFQRVQSQKQTRVVKGTMSPSTSAECSTTHSSNMFATNTESQERQATPTAVKENL